MHRTKAEALSRYLQRCAEFHAAGKGVQSLIQQPAGPLAVAPLPSAPAEGTLRSRHASPSASAAASNSSPAADLQQGIDDPRGRTVPSECATQTGLPELMNKPSSTVEELPQAMNQLLVDFQPAASLAQGSQTSQVAAGRLTKPNSSLADIGNTLSEKGKPQPSHSGLSSKADAAKRMESAAGACNITSIRKSPSKPKVDELPDFSSMLLNTAKPRQAAKQAMLRITMKAGRQSMDVETQLGQTMKRKEPAPSESDNSLTTSSLNLKSDSEAESDRAQSSKNTTTGNPDHDNVAACMPHGLLPANNEVPRQLPEAAKRSAQASRQASGPAGLDKANSGLQPVKKKRRCEKASKKSETNRMQKTSTSITTASRASAQHDMSAASDSLPKLSTALLPRRDKYGATSVRQSKKPSDVRKTAHDPFLTPEGFAVTKEFTRDNTPAATASMPGPSVAKQLPCENKEPNKVQEPEKPNLARITVDDPFMTPGGFALATEPAPEATAPELSQSGDDASASPSCSTTQPPAAVSEEQIPQAAASSPSLSQPAGKQQQQEAHPQSNTTVVTSARVTKLAPAVLTHERFRSTSQQSSGAISNGNLDAGTSREPRKHVEYSHTFAGRQTEQSPGVLPSSQPPLGGHTPHVVEPSPFLLHALNNMQQPQQQQTTVITPASGSAKVQLPPAPYPQQQATPATAASHGKTVNGPTVADKAQIPLTIGTASPRQSVPPRQPSPEPQPADEPDASQYIPLCQEGQATNNPASVPPAHVPAKLQQAFNPSPSPPIIEELSRRTSQASSSSRERSVDVHYGVKQSLISKFKSLLTHPRRVMMGRNLAVTNKLPTDTEMTEAVMGMSAESILRVQQRLGVLKTATERILSAEEKARVDKKWKECLEPVRCFALEINRALAGHVEMQVDYMDFK